MLVVLRIGQCFQKLIEAADASHILGRTGSLTFNAERIFLAGFFLRAALKEDFMVPAVAEIVLVGEAESLAGFWQDLADSSAGRIDAVGIVESIDD